MIEHLPGQWRQAVSRTCFAAARDLSISTKYLPWLHARDSCARGRRSPNADERARLVQGHGASAAFLPLLLAPGFPVILEK
jgi:hypothetical protein